MPAKSKRVAFKVSMLAPPGATIADMRDYIDEAVQTWSGQCRPAGALSEADPGDPMFWLDTGSVRVTKLKGK